MIENRSNAPDLSDWMIIKEKSKFKSLEVEKETFVLWVHDIMSLHGHMLSPGYEIEGIEEMCGMTPDSPVFEDQLDIANAIHRLESKGVLIPAERTLH